MRKNIWKLSLSAIAVSCSLPLFAQANPKLDSFENLSLGMSYEGLAAPGNSCDAPADSPGFAGSQDVGVFSTICPVAQTFAMATLVNKKVALVVLNWISWDSSQLDGKNKELNQIPEKLRQKFGIPNATIAYESQFGNSEADRFCAEKKTCQMHIWKSSSPERVASLVYAKIDRSEVPLIFRLSDIQSERSIDELKERVAQGSEKSGKNGEKIRF